MIPSRMSSTSTESASTSASAARAASLVIIERRPCTSASRQACRQAVCIGGWAGGRAGRQVGRQTGRLAAQAGRCRLVLAWMAVHARRGRRARQRRTTLLALCRPRRAKSSPPCAHSRGKRGSTVLRPSRARRPRELRPPALEEAHVILKHERCTLLCRHAAGPQAATPRSAREGMPRQAWTHASIAFLQQSMFLSGVPLCPICNFLCSNL